MADAPTMRINNRNAINFGMKREHTLQVYDRNFYRGRNGETLQIPAPTNLTPSFKLKLF